MELDHQWARSIAKAHFFGQQAEELLFGFPVDDGGFTPHQFQNGTIDARAKRFDEVVGKREGVVPVRMLQREYRVQPGGDDRTGDSGARDHIAVVEQIVGVEAVRVAAEVLPEQGRPIEAGSLPFDIRCVTTFDFIGHA